MTEDTIAVYTGDTIDRHLKRGGSGFWVIDQAKARGCKFVVCVWNWEAAHTDSGMAALEGHLPRMAFLVGKLSHVELQLDSLRQKGPRRWLLKFSEYALVTVANAWQGWRNPVRYTTLSALGIDEAALEWQPMPEASTEPEPAPPVAPLTITEAKAGLAAHFGVSLDAIEINVKF